MIPRRMPRVVYRDRPPKRGGGCAITLAFISGLLAMAFVATGNIPLMALCLGLAVLCMLSAILQKMK